MQLNFACLFFLLAGALARPRLDQDSFPGWLGERRKSSDDGSTAEGSVTTYHAADGSVAWTGEVVSLGWKPRAYIFRGFLSEEEAESLKALGAPRLTKSMVVDSATGGSKDSDVRTSSGTFLSRGQNDLVSRIEDRIALVSMVPKENGEGLQILKYVDGQKYEPHFDYFHDRSNKDNSHGGQRIATMLMYLATPEDGGETVFPNADRKVSGPGWSDCARKGFAVHPRKGDAVLFFSLKPDGTEDPSSLHGSCPVLKGEKWSATKWMHVAPFGLADKVKAGKANSSECADTNDSCQTWADEGECSRNPVYMKENCKAACGLCVPKPPGVRK